ncbi:MAG: hypothetical protein ACJ8EB_13980 [Allosphingosinicella sp.]
MKDTPIAEFKQVADALRRSARCGAREKLGMKAFAALRNGFGSA